MKYIKQFLKIILTAALVITECSIGILFAGLLFIILSSGVTEPAVQEVKIGERQKVGENHYVLGNNWLKKNEYGIWEMYIEGAPYERGLIYGELAKELVQKQEDIFVGQIKDFIPSPTGRRFIQLMVEFFNRTLPDNIPLENQQEILGVSRSFSDQYDYIAPKYKRILNYHAAHDIGHALNDYSMVGCTSFALKGDKTANGGLLIGRNFDFYVGDDFAKEKLILFLKPDDGFAFTSYSWAGFTGVVSGLNEKGLSVTINAAKSDLPTATKTPISLLAREILQYAETIDEAIAIAKKRETFVSESLLIGSSEDAKAVIIEKSPNQTSVYETDDDVLICANHYQSAEFAYDKNNVQNIANSDSKYRYAEIKKLTKGDHLSPINAAAILRNQYAENGDTLGMGNPRAVNQLIAHHSVIIQPEQHRIYFSTYDYQLGPYIAYDINDVFKHKEATIKDVIGVDRFINSNAYTKFKQFKAMKQKIIRYVRLGKPLALNDSEVQDFIASNGESYQTYLYLGEYYLKKKNKPNARKYLKLALTKNLDSENTKAEIEELLKSSK